MKNLKTLLLCSSLLGLLAGCAAGPGGGVKKGAAVEDRAVKRWELLIARNAADAYEYLTPGYRATHPKDQYAASMSSRPVKWKKVELMDKECPDEDTCTVRLVIDFELRIAAGIPGPVSSVDVQKEKWLRLKGQWYHLPAQ
ncbi:MAG: hypothetical protein JNN30_14560 [Rhodanobacteraceae bacterium]|nr:hypothetical protein [Rhodanobacteraceae bacterium]